MAPLNSSLNSLGNSSSEPSLVLYTSETKLAEHDYTTDESTTSKRGRRARTKVELPSMVELRNERESLLDVSRQIIQTEIAGWEHTVTKLKEKCHTLEDELLNKQEDLNIERRAIQRLQSEKSSMMKQVTQWKDKFEQMGCLYDELVANIGDLTDENESLRAKCQRFEELQEREAKKNESNSSVVEEDSSLLDQLKSGNEELSQKVTMLDEQNERLEKANGELVEILDELVIKVNILDDENSQLQMRLEELLDTEKGKKEKASHNNSSDIPAKSALRTKSNKQSSSGQQEKQKDVPFEDLWSSPLNPISEMDEASFVSAELEDMNPTKESEKKRVAFADQVENKDKHVNMNLTEALVMIEEMRIENDALHQSMEESMTFVVDMNEKMAIFVRDHESSVKNYEDTISSLEDELKDVKSSRDKLNVKLLVMRAEIEDAQDVKDDYEQDMIKKAYHFLRDDMKNIVDARDRAIEKCKLLQKEMKVLRQQNKVLQSKIANNKATGSSNNDQGTVHSNSTKLTTTETRKIRHPAPPTSAGASVSSNSTKTIAAGDYDANIFVSREALPTTRSQFLSDQEEATMSIRLQSSSSANRTGRKYWLK